MLLDNTKKDFLTGFYMRELFTPYLRDLVVQTKLKKGEFSMMILDIDKFKNYNDKYGHQFGDEVLKYVAGSMRLSLFDAESTLFRYGGDEFVIVLPEKKPREAAQLAYRLKYNITHRPFLYKNSFYKITMSIGIAGYPSDAEKLEGLIKKSDEAMYFSKRNGRNQATLASRIGYLKFRSLVSKLVTLAFILALAGFLYVFAFKQPIKNTIDSIRGIKEMGLSAPDTIRLKNGNVLSGKIIDETRDNITMEFHTDSGGSGTITLKRSEISSILRGK